MSPELSVQHYCAKVSLSGLLWKVVIAMHRSMAEHTEDEIMKDRMFLVACVVLVGLALCSLATCGRKNAEMDKLHDAVISGDLQEVNVLIKDNPWFSFQQR